MLKQTEKIYLDNPDLYMSISDEIGFSSNIGTIREIFFIKMIINSRNKIHVSKIGYFEIGGKNKDKKQLKENIEKGYLVKDDILYGSNREIPLHLFGFLY